MTALVTEVAFALLLAHSVSVSRNYAHVKSSMELSDTDNRSLLACQPEGGESSTQGDDEEAMTKLVIRSLPKRLRAESVVPRILCRDGAGNAIPTCPLRVFDVSVRTVTRVVERKDEDSDELHDAVQVQLSDLREALEKSMMEEGVLELQRRTVETWMNSVVTGGGESEARGIAIPEEEEVYKMLESTGAKFEEMHAKRSLVRSRIARLRVDIAALEKKFEASSGWRQSPELGKWVKGGGGKNDNNVYQDRDLEIVLVRDATASASADFASMKLEVALEYGVDGVTWSPSYHMHLDPQQEKATIEYYASITSDAGEDWKNVNMSLSTGRTDGANMPELKPIQIHVSKPPPPGHTHRRGGARMNKRVMMRQPQASHRNGMLQELRGGMDMEMEMEEEEEEEMVMAYGMAPPEEEAMGIREKSSSASAMTFDIPRRVTIISDNSPHKVKVAKLDVTARLRFLCVPSKDTGCWLSARVSNTSPYLLLPGPLTSFIDGELVSQSHVAASINPQETFQLVLSKQEGLKAEARTVKEAEKVGSFLQTQKKSVERVRRSILVKNHKPYAVEVDVRDQAPYYFDVTKTDKVSVSVTQPAPSQLSKDEEDEGGEGGGRADRNNLPCPFTSIDDKNMVTWVREIEPNETLKLMLEYAVEYKLADGETIQYS